MAAENIAGVVLTIAAAAMWYVLGIGPIVLWLILAAVAAPIVGRAIAADEAFDVAWDAEDED